MALLLNYLSEPRSSQRWAKANVRYKGKLKNEDGKHTSRDFAQRFAAMLRSFKTRRQFLPIRASFKQANEVASILLTMT